MKVIRGYVLLILIFAVVDICAQNTSDSALPPGDKPPPTVFDRLESAGDADDYEDADHAIVYDLTVNRVKESGVTEVEGTLLYKILNHKGCKNLSVLNWGYDPQSSYVDVTEVNIIRGDELIQVDVVNVIDVPASQSGIYWSNRIKALQLPRLHIGDGIEVKTYRKGFTYALLDNHKPGNEPPADDRYIPPMPGEYFDIVRFEATVPIIEKKYVLSLPKGKQIQSQIFNGPLYSSTTYTADSTTYAWWTLNMPAWKPERYRPSATDIVTKVVLSTAESWEAKSRWFYEINEGQFDVTPAIQAKVDDILKKAGVANAGEDKRAAELLHWVAQNIRYSGQTMGEGEGFTLHPGWMIFEQRSGVCKDIAGMLVTMMRAAGMDSYAAMTMAGSRIEDVPADQFNHCVVALKKDDGRFVMYDPTWVPFYKDIWSKLESEQHYVIGTPEGEDLSRIDYSPPEESPLRVTSNVKIDSDGNLEGIIELRSDGAIDSRLRRMFSGHRRSELDHYIAGVLQPISDRVEGISYKYGDLLDFSSGMWCRIDYRIPAYAVKVKEGLEFRSPMMQMTMHNRLLLRPGDHEWAEERHDDVFLYYTQLLSGEETISIPRGLKLAKELESGEIDETYAYFKGSASMKSRKLLINQRIELRRRQIPPEGYSGFRDAINGATGFSESVFRVE